MTRELLGDTEDTRYFAYYSTPALQKMLSIVGCA